MDALLFWQVGNPKVLAVACATRAEKLGQLGFSLARLEDARLIKLHQHTLRDSLSVLRGVQATIMSLSSSTSTVHIRPGASTREVQKLRQPAVCG